ncbi:MAG: Rrf2 family transcriptional regulator [Bdellovibrionales bacterium]
MIRLNRKIEYALMALRIINARPASTRTSAKEIVEITGAPFDATARVLQQMGQSGILRSEHGAHGGYVLVRNLSEVSYYELLECILGPQAAARCLMPSGQCEMMSTCNIIGPLGELNRRYQTFYKSVKIGELLTKEEHVPHQVPV